MCACLCVFCVFCFCLFLCLLLLFSTSFHKVLPCVLMTMLSACPEKDRNAVWREKRNAKTSSRYRRSASRKTA